MLGKTRSWPADVAERLLKLSPVAPLRDLGCEVFRDGDAVVAALPGKSPFRMERSSAGIWLCGERDIFETIGDLGFQDAMGRVMESHLKNARSTRPDAMWERLGYEIEISGKELRIHKNGGKCLYRTFLGKDGNWFSGPRDPGGAIAPHVGDNISVYAHFSSGGKGLAVLDWYRAALDVAELAEKSAAPRAAKREEADPVMPIQTRAAREAGRAYLSRERGISREIIDICEECGLLAYEDRGRYPAQLVFCGYRPDGKLGMGSKRTAAARIPKNSSKTYNIPGSKVRYAPVYHGSGTVFVVESGVNLMSVLEMHKRLGLPLPTVFATAGQGNRSWLSPEEDGNREIIRNADRVFLVAENDDESDAGGAEKKRRMAGELSDICGGRFSVFAIPRPCNDINDVLCANPDLLDEIGREQLLGGAAPGSAEKEAAKKERPFGNQPIRG